MSGVVLVPNLSVSESGLITLVEGLIEGPAASIQKVFSDMYLVA